MSVTLTQIWQSPTAALQPVLRQYKRDLTGNLQHDRAVVALIYYTANMLNAVDRVWVAHSGFLSVANQTDSLNAIILTLKRPFADKLMTMKGLLTHIYSKATGPMRTYIDYHMRDGQLGYDMGGYISRRLMGHGIFSLPGQVVLTTIGAPSAPISSISEQSILLSKYVGSDLYTSVSEDSVRAKLAVINDKIIKEAKIDEITVETITPVLQHALTSAAVKLVTQAIAARGDRLVKGVNTIPISPNTFDIIAVMTSLLNLDLSDMERTYRCYYLYWMWDLLSEVPPVPQRDVLLAKLDGLIQQYGYQEIFANVAVIQTLPGLSPLTGKLDSNTEAGLSHLIGEFVGRPPTRAEVLARIAVM